ncbi:hypothetical protein [Aurantiacibacter gilvus]|uniref:Uncharacterized protein n=1 Tax=Aurantiacibacter gilvus TaxID=3139141 RepID=A0ABU9IGR9_9SPHN
MKKAIATALIAITMTTAATPAMAGGTRDSRHDDWADLISVGSFAAETYVQMISLLLPAVQAAREAA